MLTLLAIVTLLLSPARPIADATVSAPDTATYRIDVGHSDVTFRIRHMITRVTGTFNEWSGTIRVDPADWSTGFVDVTIQAASIDTRHATRDRDLRSANFFDVERFPTITFRSRSVTAKDSALTIAGDLTMHGVTRPVVLHGEFIGAMGTGAGKERLGFSASTIINRTDFGVTWNRALEGGGALLGDDVEVTITLQAVRM